MSFRPSPGKIARDKRKAMIAGVEYVEPKPPYSSLSRDKKNHEGTVDQRQNFLTRSTPLKAKGKRSRENDPKDRAASKRCKALAFHTCALAGPECSGHLEAHHVIHRQHQKTRFDQRNLVCVCWWHHQIWIHNHEAEFLAIFEQMRPGVYGTLRALAFGFEPEVAA